MEKILVLDFGGQYDQLIARRVRELRVYADVRYSHAIGVSEILAEGFSGIIFTGGPNSVYASDSPSYDPAVLNLGIPILGICYGAQLMAYMAGGHVENAADRGEFGRTDLYVSGDSPLLKGVPEKSICWMSHTDSITHVPYGFSTVARTDKCPCAAMSNEAKKLYAVQFHPEVTHTAYGEKILENFLYGICGLKGDWDVEDYAEQMIRSCRERLKGKKVLLALSGGVDSSVTAALLSRAIGEDLTCVFVDHGLMRKNEGDLVEGLFRDRFSSHFVRVQAEKRFLNRLAGVTDPEEKRKIIGAEFIRVFEEEAGELGHIDVLAQGTIYPDVIESGKGDSAVIKSHHNVGGLPESIGFSEIVEPLRELFKDEVRHVGTLLGLPKELVWRQPFPGPGLGVRVMGEVTKEKLTILQDADAIFREELSRAGLQDLPDQYFAVLTDTKSVGVKGDARNYGYVIALRAVETDDFMTAVWSRLPYEVLERSSDRITNEVAGVSRVVYDISSKPPATVEWE